MKLKKIWSWGDAYCGWICHYCVQPIFYFKPYIVLLMYLCIFLHLSTVTAGIQSLQGEAHTFLTIKCGCCYSSWYLLLNFHKRFHTHIFISPKNIQKSVKFVPSTVSLGSGPFFWITNLFQVFMLFEQLLLINLKINDILDIYNQTYLVSLYFILKLLAQVCSISKKYNNSQTVSLYFIPFTHVYFPKKYYEQIQKKRRILGW